MRKGGGGVEEKDVKLSLAVVACKKEEKGDGESLYIGRVR